MVDLSKLFDAYNRQARLYPALIAVLPLLLLVLSLAPSLLTAPSGAALVALAAATGVLFLLAETARRRGKLTEERLLRLWGGWPTTLRLRHADPNLATATKARYHRKLAARASLRFPTNADEQLNPSDADDTYRSAVEWLKEHCRGPGFELIAKENAAYGFRRNFRGLKPISVGIAATSAIVMIGIVIATLPNPPSASAVETTLQSSSLLLAALALTLMLLVHALIFVTDGWVREAADSYARALLAACETL